MSTDTKDIDTDNHQAEKRVLIAAIAAQGLALFALASLFALLPTMIRDLQLNSTATLWTVNAYTLMTASLALVGGVLGDQFGRKRTLIWGVILFALGSAGVALAPGANLLIGSRAVQGIGAAIILTGTVSIIRAAFPPLNSPRCGRRLSASTYSYVGAFPFWAIATFHFWQREIRLCYDALLVQICYTDASCRLYQFKWVCSISVEPRPHRPGRAGIVPQPHKQEKGE